MIYVCAGCRCVRRRTNYVIDDWLLARQPQCACGSKTIRIQTQQDVAKIKVPFKPKDKSFRKSRKLVLQLKGRI